MKITTFHAEQWGPLGAIFATACCLGLTWLVSLVAALGAGFLIRDSILMPLLVVFLAVSVWGLSRSYRRHSWAVPLAAGCSGAVLLLVGMFTARRFHTWASSCSSAHRCSTFTLNSSRSVRARQICARRNEASITRTDNKISGYRCRHKHLIW